MIEEWFEAKRDHEGPEFNLMLAILTRAIQDLVTPGIDHGDKLDANRWFFCKVSDEQAMGQQWPFALSAVAEMLNVDPDYLRKQAAAIIRRAKREGGVMKLRFRRNPGDGLRKLGDVIR